VRRLIIFIKLFLLYCPVIFAQVDEPHFNMNLEGQFVATANAEALFINMGGPAIKLVFPKCSIAINMYPSFKFEVPASKLIVTPQLGVGPQLNFLKEKRFIIAFPCYYQASKSNWTATAGIGYIFTKPKKQL
jgi:hypothetical protein